MKNRTTVILGRVVLCVMAAIFLFPFLISILLAFKTKQETTKSVLALPSALHIENFVDAIEKANIFRSMANSLIVTAASVILVLIVASMAGYAIGRQYHKKGYKFYESVLTAAMMVPFQSLMIPIYRMYRGLGLLNTLPGIIILIAGINMPFAIMTYIGFVRTVPMELEEAAKLEGCTVFQTFVKVIFPILKPTTVTIAVLDALWAWNDFNASLIVLQKNAVKTVPMQQYVFFGEHSADYNMAFAAAVITMIPVVLFFLVMQKHIEGGMTAGAVKG